ncbi:MAG: hypothetical protein ACYSWS_05920 [Planctomycetota bacterium]
MRRIGQGVDKDMNELFRRLYECVHGEFLEGPSRTDDELVTGFARLTEKLLQERVELEQDIQHLYEDMAGEAI